MQSKESLELWRIHLQKRHEAEATDNGKHSHRVNSTGFIDGAIAINEIIDLAKKQLEMQSRGGKVAKKLAIQYLRDMVGELESELD